MKKIYGFRLIELITMSFLLVSSPGVDVYCGEVVEFYDDSVEVSFEESEKEKTYNEQGEVTIFESQEWNIQSSDNAMELDIVERTDENPVIIEYTESYQDMALAGEGYSMSNESLHSLVIVKTDDYFDFSAWGAEKIVAGPDSHFVLQFPTMMDAQAAINMLLENEHVIYAEPDDAFVFDCSVMEGSIEQELWNIDLLGVESVVQQLSDSLIYKDEVVVAVLDTGFSTDGIGYDGRILEGINVCNGSTNVSDIERNGLYHGTHVTGTILENTKGLDNIKIKAIKMYEERNVNGRREVVSSKLLLGSAIDTAKTQRADVINISAGTGESAFIHEMTEKAIIEGCTVVVSSGNYASNVGYYCPANVTTAITVGSVNRNLQRSPFSNYGNELDFIAPGEDVPSLQPGGNYATISGTSMAAPHISALCALVCLMHPEYSPEEVHDYLVGTCIDLEQEGWDENTGWGLPCFKDVHLPYYTVTYHNGGTIDFEVRESGEEFIVHEGLPQRMITVSYDDSHQIEKRIYESSFINWVDSFNNQYVAGEGYPVFDNIILYPQWSDVRLEFMPEPELEGYRFIGWFTELTGGVQVKVGDFIMDDLTLYAQWAPTAVIKSLSVTPSVTICAGKKASVKAEVIPEQPVTWSSSNTKYATVNSKGIVTTKAAGAGKTVTVTAKTPEGIKKSIKIRIVKDGVSKIELSGKRFVPVGRQITVKAIVTAGSTANTKVRWYSSNLDYASVSRTGIVTGKMKDKYVRITAVATDGTGVKGSIKIKVR